MYIYHGVTIWINCNTGFEEYPWPNCKLKFFIHSLGFGKDCFHFQNWNPCFHYSSNGQDFNIWKLLWRAILSCKLFVNFSLKLNYRLFLICLNKFLNKCTRQNVQYIMPFNCSNQKRSGKHIVHKAKVYQVYLPCQRVLHLSAAFWIHVVHIHSCI